MNLEYIAGPGRHPEQYELDDCEPLARDAEPGLLHRRDFLKVLGTGLVVLSFGGALRGQGESGGGARAGGRNARPTRLDAWLRIGDDGHVIFYTGKTEVGQNIRTSLTQAIAEELPLRLDWIEAVMADTDLTPYDMGTFGSRSTPDMGTQLRRVAATAREALLDLAAAEWSVNRATLRVDDGKIYHSPSGRAASYGELTRGKKLVREISSTTALKPATEWRVAGTAVPKVNGRDFVTGSHRYAADIVRPNMLFGRVLRAPAYGAELATFDGSAAEAMPGVRVVRDGDFVGIVARSSHLAAQGLQALRATWKTTPQISEAEFFAQMRGGAANPTPELTRSADGALVLRQSYSVAFIAHVPLEPRAAVAEWTGPKLTVWTGSQRPFGIRDSELARAFNLGPEYIRVIVPDTGSGYGGKHTGQAAVEAARLARAAAQPVKLIWTREEEFTWAYFRPAGVIDIASGVTAAGVLTDWEFLNYNSGDAGIAPPYVITRAKTAFHRATSPLPQGSYRSLAAAANHFARESHIDELALALKMDPLEFRRKNIADERLLAVIAAGAKAFRWGSGTGSGTGHGIAVGIDKGGHIATFAEVVVEPSGRVRATRVVQAFECGAVVNPDHLKLQLEGAIVQGLGGALFEAIHFENGKISNPHLAAYRVPRFTDSPRVEVILVDRKDLPSAGAGETGIVGIAPALGNALANATGVRLRSLPLAPNGVKVA